MNSPWNKDWLEAQRQYMEALMSLGKAGSEQQATGTQVPGWQQAQQQWWQNKLFESPADPQAMFSRFMQYASSWQALSQQFNDMLSALSASGDNKADWQQELKAQIELIKAQVLKTSGNVDTQNWQAGMQAPMDAWQKLFGSINSGAAANPANFQTADLFADMQKFFSSPGLENNELLQEQMQAGLNLWQQYQDNCRSYGEMLSNIDLSSLDKLQEKIIALADQDKAISSLRDLYNLWVDAHEETYSSQVLTEEYSKLYGELINSLLKFNEHSKHFISEVARLMQSPTTEEQASLLQEVEKLKQQREKDKKQIKSLQEQIRNAGKGAAGKTKTKKKQEKEKKC